MKSLRLLLISFFLLLPINVNAISQDYEDIIHHITEEKVEDNKINIYAFVGEGCPHCHKEQEFLKDIEKKYAEKVNIFIYETWYDKNNLKIFEKVKKELNVSSTGVPFTVIGDKHYVGFSGSIKSLINNDINDYVQIKKEKNNMHLPILGDVDKKSVSIPIVAIVLGFVDGFNPCAMWVLLFLIGMLFNMQNRKKMWILGMTFLFISGLVYFISLLGISIVLSFTTVLLKHLIALVVIFLGGFNLYKYFKTKQNTGCEIIDDKKRNKIFTRIKNIINNKSFFLAIIGMIMLAISVNLIELACTFGFPMIFAEILALNNIEGFARIGYLLLYIIIYMLDDIVVFVIAMITLNLTGISTKYSKYSYLIGGVIMIIMGILLLIP
ncbi:MAG: hypothetical protein PHH51_02825 [Bacilli bacterium]|nr:hypothetical protein [Bacilli bacterium]MDD3896061.1 hypothetical protein [Bacilli bacterium]MDD4408044.1 hypothetical protein [Bacilli bacterium]